MGSGNPFGLGMRIWDPATGPPLHRLSEGITLCCGIYSSTDRRFLAVGNYDYGSYVFAATDGARPWQEGSWRTALGPRAPAAAVSPDGRVLAWAGEFGHGFNLLLADMPSQNGMFATGDPRNRVTALTFTPDGRGILFRREDGSLLLLGPAAHSKHTSSATGAS